MKCKECLFEFSKPGIAKRLGEQWKICPHCEKPIPTKTNTSMEDHYKKAEGIDQYINEVLQNNPVTLENARNWITFCRTVTSGLDVIKDEARNLLLIKIKEKIKMADATENCSFIINIWTEQTGGNVMVDYIRLKSGELIGISDECIVNYGKVIDSHDADEDIFDDKNVIYLELPTEKQKILKEMHEQGIPDGVYEMYKLWRS